MEFQRLRSTGLLLMREWPNRPEPSDEDRAAERGPRRREGVRDEDRPISIARLTTLAIARLRPVQLGDSTESSGSSLTRARLRSEP